MCQSGFKERGKCPGHFTMEGLRLTPFLPREQQHVFLDAPKLAHRQGRTRHKRGPLLRAGSAPASRTLLMLL